MGFRVWTNQLGYSSSTTFSPLDIAAITGNCDAIQILLDAKAAIDDKDWMDDHGSAIERAAWCGVLPAVQLLADRGAAHEFSRERSCELIGRGHLEIACIVAGGDVISLGKAAASAEDTEKMIHLLAAGCP